MAGPSGTIAQLVTGSVTISGTIPVSGTVAVSSLPALVAGSAVIGHVIVDTAPTTAVTIASLPSLAAGSAVIGHVIADTGSTTAVTGNVTVVQPTGTNLHVVVDSAPTTAVTIASLPALAAGSAVIGHVIVDTAPSTAVTNAGTFAVQATISAGAAVIGHVIADTGSTTVVTGNVTVVQATGTNLHVVVDTAPTTAVTGPLTDTQLRATAVPVSATQLPVALAAGGGLKVEGVVGGVAQPISAASLPLPTNAATDARQDTGNTSLASIKTNTDSLVTAAAGGYVRQDSTATMAKESGGNLATIAAKDFATQTTLAAMSAGLLLAQGASSTSVTGPLMQGLVDDTPPLATATSVIQPLSLTQDGRLRVSTLPATVDQIWQHTFDGDPWDQDGSTWGAFPTAAGSSAFGDMIHV